MTSIHTPKKTEVDAHLLSELSDTEKVDVGEHAFSVHAAHLPCHAIPSVADAHCSTARASATL